MLLHILYVADRTRGLDVYRVRPGLASNRNRASPGLGMPTS